ncbi:MAG: preprotein translocase subunit SecG [Clostridia bacterium]|nr:preprotein translocase subunit SecG [Clostridia bacterium]MBQ8720135.1 preprotein translocase subunit SecG [Clostridia bacterium]
MIGELILIIVLLLSAIFLVVAILFQKTSEDGLSGTIAGGTETFYGKDKSVGIDRLLRKWTMIAGIVFVVAVLAVYVFQPDYASSMDYVDWKSLSSYSYLFGE